MRNTKLDSLVAQVLAIISTSEDVSQEDARGAIRALCAAGFTLDALAKYPPTAALTVVAMVRFRGDEEPPDPIARPASSADGPPDWRLYSRRIMDTYRPGQAAVLGALQTATLPSVQVIAPYVEALGAAQSKVGVWSYLWYPVGDGSMAHQLTVFSGIESPWGSDWKGARVIDLSLPVSPLFRLAEEARRIARGTGLWEADAVAFLLADVDVTLPWIQCAPVYHGGGRGLTVEIHVGSTTARPAEVAAAYEVFLARHDRTIRGMEIAGKRTAHWPRPNHATPYVRGRITGKTDEIVRFVNSYRRERNITGSMPGGEWAKVCTAFNEHWHRDHPDDAPIKANSIRVMYTNAKKGG